MMVSSKQRMLKYKVGKRNKNGKNKVNEEERKRQQ